MRIQTQSRILRTIAPLFAALLALPLHAQQETTTITLGATLVTLPAVVRDKQGAFLNALTVDNFALRVDGQRQPIRYFDHDTDQPLTLGLLVDTSMSQYSLLDDERSASRLFLDKMLAPTDQAFVMQFDKRVLLLQDLTAARPPLEAALANVDSPHPKFIPNGTESRMGTMRADRQAVMAVVGTRLFDAVCQSADDITAKQTGRRALILLTDGGDHGSLKTLDDAVEAAQRADTVIYAIYYVASPMATRRAFRDEIKNGPSNNFVGSSDNDASGMAPPGGDGLKILEHMTSETGGKVFEVSSRLTVTQIYAKIAEELRAQYRIGFTPSGATAAEGYHHLQLALTGPAAKGKHTVQTRTGYYAGKSQ